MASNLLPMNYEPMLFGPIENDVAANLAERRWFGAVAAADSAERELQILREVMELSQSAFRRARCRWQELKDLRDALGVEVAACDERREIHAVTRQDH